MIGYNYRMSNLLAAVGRAQLATLAERVEARRRIFDSYVDLLGDIDGIEFMPEAPYGRSNRWLTTLTIDPVRFGAGRDDILRVLDSENIEARPVWKPMHCQPVFAGSRVFGGAVSEQIFDTGICLPSGTGLTRRPDRSDRGARSFGWRGLGRFGRQAGVAEVCFTARRSGRREVGCGVKRRYRVAAEARMGSFEGIVALRDQHFVELLAGTQPGVDDLGISPRSHLAGEPPGKHVDGDGFAHVEHEDIAAASERRGLEDEEDGLFDRHEVAGHIRIGDRDRLPALDLLHERRDHRAVRTEHVAESHRQIATGGGSIEV